MHINRLLAIGVDEAVHRADAVEQIVAAFDLKKFTLNAWRLSVVLTIVCLLRLPLTESKVLAGGSMLRAILDV
uniref:Uncharacterized protein n=1 Tax=Meloidogyne incognita TaxID=6306 RepID=A0A914L8H5_MELIC